MYMHDCSPMSLFILSERSESKDGPTPQFPGSLFFAGRHPSLVILFQPM